MFVHINPLGFRCIVLHLLTTLSRVKSIQNDI
nr:MAG TPA: hypothetical protein [Caudoviricetes sp.]